MTSIWDELGIAPTTDAAAIRRAYAARLKAVRPDADPQGFARLRAAYERCLALANSTAPPQPNVAPAPRVTIPDPPSIVLPVLRPPPDPMPVRSSSSDSWSANIMTAARHFAGTAVVSTAVSNDTLR